MTVKERVEALRAKMKETGVDAYVVPTADFHQSEYVGEHFKARVFITGFDGSAGTAVITKDEAHLWTDGRYFIQAEHQMEGSGVTLMKMRTVGYPTMTEFLMKTLKTGDTLGFDGRVVSVDEGVEYEKCLPGVKINYDLDLIDEIWEGRTPLSSEKAYVHEDKYAGETIESKFARLRDKMKEYGATCHIIANLDDVNWLFNIRGNDVEYSPLLLSYAFVTLDKAFLFVDESKLDDNVRKELARVDTIVKPYNDIYEFVKGIPTDEKLLMDKMKLNYALYKNIPASVAKIEQANPATLMKAMKNETEIKGMKSAQLKDAVAHVKFMYWLKTNVGKMDITEISAGDKLDEFRAEQGDFIGPSFEPIIAYKEHAASMHYAPTPEEQYEIKPEGMVLTDTGGNYKEGTTDITRTYLVGPVSDEIKKHFTNVARGMIDLSMARFLYGCHGYNLDVLARMPMWQLGLDYKCGTGHGVGNNLNIHEGPTGFRWYVVPEKNEDHILEPGMYITDEPGIYVEGSHGIRLENELLVVEDGGDAVDRYLKFETMTFVPLDLDGIIPSLMTEPERAFLNWYHAEVYNKVSPYLYDEEKEWLKEYTRAI
ncbi:MAG: aminopeptidase P family protein [Lachnospiraceae bacterium]|jgi:Xaa-Pro aminopeptidase|nr:aminopeptidase P family protein [Lachnospiraceae bacterium]